jgi:hypothetical protein
LAEVKAEAKAKAAAKAVKKQVKQDQIEHVAGFETKVMANEDLMDATPQPNFAPRSHTCVKSEDLESKDPEVDEPNADGHTYVPGDSANPDNESDDEESVEVMPISARRKKQAPIAPTKASKPVPARKVSKQLDTIAESSEDETEQPLSKVTLKKRAMVVEDSDDDGIKQLSKKLKVKAKKSQETASLESELDLPPPKKAKVAQEDVGLQEMAEKSGKRKKESVCKAIAAVQEWTAPITEFDTSNDGGTNEEWGETMAVTKHTA